MIRVLTGLVFPYRCVACGAPSRWLCEACDASFPWLRASCARCAQPSVMPLDECGKCRAARPPFDIARSCAVYTGCARDALIAFKLGGERRSARAIAERMVSVAPRSDLVTFVPATRRSVVERGFNPAEELARRIARALNLRCVPLLRKTRETKDQSGLDRSARQANVAGAFSVIPERAGAAARGRILLVDDVMTTGATASACALALRGAGMGQIAILTFARAG